MRKAYEHLNEGGRLVSLMSEGSFFGNDAKAVDFREWLESVNGYSDKLEPGSFTGVQAFRQTGVAIRVVVIDK